MPTKTRKPARRRAPTTTRFARTPARPQPRFTPRGKTVKAAKPTGLAGLLSKLTPAASSTSSAKGATASMAKPAAALLAAGAGALLGRKQLAKRKSNEGEMHTFPPQPPTAPVA